MLLAAFTVPPLIAEDAADDRRRHTGAAHDRPNPHHTYATPVAGSATADVSPTVRPAQPVSVCQLGFVNKPCCNRCQCRPDRFGPTALCLGPVTRWVPPTATTVFISAGEQTAVAGISAGGRYRNPGVVVCCVLIDAPPFDGAIAVAD